MVLGKEGLLASARGITQGVGKSWKGTKALYSMQQVMLKERNGRKHKVLLDRKWGASSRSLLCRKRDCGGEKQPIAPAIGARPVQV